MNAPATPSQAIDQAISELRQGAQSLCNSSLGDRIRLAEQCIAGVVRVAQSWCEAGCQAKRTSDSAAGRAEELFGGPLGALRFLRLTIATLHDIKTKGLPQLPGSPREVAGQIRVPVFPTGQMFDKIAFGGLRAECWLQPEVSIDQRFGDSPARLRRQTVPAPRIELVLGAGNVSAIPITDALSKIFHEDCAVLLKMNPVNEYLGPIFSQALEPLIQAGWLRIIYGASSVGSYACQHPQVQGIHITGSTDSHEIIVWGSDPDERAQRKREQRPLLDKPISSELGNVTPWIIVPAHYSDSELRSQAESVAASIINNASFNCVATKMIITSRQWAQRQKFLEMLQQILNNTPPRYAYYPGAAERHGQFSGRSCSSPDGRLPWVLRTGLQIGDDALMFQRESFVCVLGESSLDSQNEVDFLDKAVEFVNDQMTGTLAVGLTVSKSHQRQHAASFDDALQRLRYGTIGINQWSALGFAWMSTPWGGYPGATIQDVQSGIGTVHNTYLLNKPQKVVIYGPLKISPKPVWFSNHRCPDAVAQKLLALYAQPTLLRLPALLLAALRG